MTDPKTTFLILVEELEKPGLDRNKIRDAGWIIHDTVRESWGTGSYGNHPRYLTDYNDLMRIMPANQRWALTGSGEAVMVPEGAANPAQDGTTGRVMGRPIAALGVAVIRAWTKLLVDGKFPVCMSCLSHASEQDTYYWKCPRCHTVHGE